MSDGQKEEVASLPNVVVYETSYKLEWMGNPWEDIDASGKWLLQLANDLKPDIIHLNNYSYGSLDFNAPKIVVAHSDVFSWWKAVKGEMPSEEWDEYFKRVQEGLEGADFIIAPSQSMMQCLRELFGVTTKGNAIYNGRSKTPFLAKEKTRSVFSMGRVWDEAKNISLLMKASSEIDCPVRIAGDNQFGSNQIKLDNKKISVLGKLNALEVAEELATASVYVLPAKYEPFGLSILEAAYSGCALVLGDIPSLREIWGDAAIYVDTNCEKELAEKVNALVNDKELLKEYSSRAERRADMFSSEAMAKEYLDVYAQVVQYNYEHLKQEIF